MEKRMIQITEKQARKMSCAGCDDNCIRSRCEAQDKEIMKWRKAGYIKKSKLEKLKGLILKIYAQNSEEGEVITMSKTQFRKLETLHNEARKELEEME
jgi:hypothetical protein